MSPSELVKAAAERDLTVVALTDHDTTAGWAEAIRACPRSITLVPGAELSCRWTGTTPPVELHLLGYWFDPAQPELVAALAAIRQDRATRGARMAELLAEDGIDVDWETVLADAGGGTIGRPHLARALVRKGIVPSVGAAFAPEWLGDRYHLPKRSVLDVFEALRLIKRAGGAAVLAHPLASRRGPTPPDSLIAELAAHGLAGLEVNHPDHTSQQREHARGLATSLGLIGTGSSDFHGSNKTVALGECTTPSEEFRRLRAVSPRGLGAGSWPVVP